MLPYIRSLLNKGLLLIIIQYELLVSITLKNLPEKLQRPRVYLCALKGPPDNAVLPTAGRMLQS